MSADRRFLKARLPSGRCLWYYKPSVAMGKTPWGENKEMLFYQGEDPKTHQWTLLKTYGGAIVENITQAIARDLMAGGMLRCEAAGYPILLTCHDELLAELWEIALKAGKSLEEFIRLMCAVEPWAAGCPIAAEGWVGHRYRK